MKDPNNCDAVGNKETCAACGAQFGCEPTGNCWCFEEKPSAGTLAALKGRYERCLCPACLRKAIEQAVPASQA